MGWINGKKKQIFKKQMEIKDEEFRLNQSTVSLDGRQVGIVRQCYRVFTTNFDNYYFDKKIIPNVFRMPTCLERIQLSLTLVNS